MTTRTEHPGICVYGGSSDHADPLYYEAAYQLGQGIGKRGWKLVYGAGDTGMMGAAARGAESEGGEIFGIAPSFFDQPGILFKQGQDVIFTRTMRERKAFMESLANGFVVTPGGVGTLEEFYEILTLKELHQLDAPLIVLNINGYYNDLIDMMNVMKKKQFVTARSMDSFIPVSTVEEAFQELEAALAK